MGWANKRKATYNVISYCILENRVVLMTSLSSLVVVLMTDCSATTNDKVGAMTTLGHVYVITPLTWREFVSEIWNRSAVNIYCMMTSSSGNIFRVTGHLCGEFTGHRWIFPLKGQWRRALIFSLICAWINGWINNREACDLRRHRAYFDVTVMGQSYSHGNTAFGILNVLSEFSPKQTYLGSSCADFMIRNAMGIWAFKT